MFTIIGGDGKEYGPVPADQVRSWLASGRADLTTKAKAAGTEEWRALGDFAEFTAPVQPPLVVAGKIDAKVYAADLIARAAPLDIGGCLTRSWDLLKGNFWPLVGVNFVVLLATLVINSIPIIGIVGGLLLGGVLYGGLYYYYLKMIRGLPAEFSDAFSGFSRAFLPLVLTSLVVLLMTTLGFVCLVLPGIYLGVSYTFAYLLVIDRKMEFWAAMEVSRRVITAQWWRMFGLLIFGVIITVLGLLGLLVGIFVTVPIFMGAVVYAYEDLCNPPPRA